MDSQNIIFDRLSQVDQFWVCSSYKIISNIENEFYWAYIWSNLFRKNNITKIANFEFQISIYFVTAENWI
jgi:hypothetical protein